MSSSYRQIFKTSALLGGTQVLVILIGMVRSKALALIIGPAGTGFVGLYNSTSTMISTATGLGIRSSGVRQIAAAAAVNDDVALANSVVTLRWCVRVTGILGGFISLLFCRQLSALTFGTTEYATGVALMSLVLVFEGVSAGQWALLQGLRKIRELAKARLLGALFGAVASISILGVLGEAGIVPFIICAAFFSVLVSWWYARQVKIPRVDLSLERFFNEAKLLISLGAAFVVSGLIGCGVAYLSRIIIMRNFGTVGVGLYGSALALSGLFVGFVLDAMGKDFYPRLTAIADCDAEVNKLVNEQTEMVLLLSSSGILAFGVLAPWLLPLFYSGEYLGAVELLRWQMLGMMFKVLSWPMGFIQLAKNSRRIFLLTEISFAIISAVALVLSLQVWGLAGAGISVFISYGVHIVINLLFAYKLSKFHWSADCIKTILPISILTTITFISVMVDKYSSYIVAIILVLATVLWCIYRIECLLKINMYKYIVSKICKNV